MSTSVRLLKRLFSIRNLMRALFVLVLLITLWTIFCLEERWRGEKQWKAYRDQAAQRGVKLTMQEVIPRDLPDAENFAAIPMFQELFHAPAAGQPAPKWFIQAKLGELEPPLAVRNGQQPVLEGYRDLFVERGLVPAPADDAPAAVLTALKLVEPELRGLRAAGKRPGAKFPVPWEKGFAATLPHVGPIRKTCQLYQLGIRAELAKGNTAEAFQYFRDGLRLHQALKNECALISGLVRLACLRSIEESVVDGDSLSRWSDEQLLEIPSALAPVDFSADFTFALASERALLNTVYDEALTRSNSELAELSAITDVRHSLFSVSLYPRGWFRLSQLKSNEHFDRTVAHGLQVGTKIPEDPILRSTNYFQSLPYVLYRAASPGFDNVPKSYAHAQVFHDQVLTACALERFRRKNKSFPEKLDALTPEFMAKVPRDPADGAPMRYRREDQGGFILWSVGLNLIDDGGKTNPKESSRQQPDWVLQVPGRP